MTILMGDNHTSRATTIRIPDRKECLTPDTILWDVSGLKHLNREHRKTIPAACGLPFDNSMIGQVSKNAMSPATAGQRIL
jgi:hypothetical protein